MEQTCYTLKFLILRKEKGGFQIISLGGGKQTKSLRLKELKGDKEWTLRSVDKDPEKALPSNLRGTMAQAIVEDMISASHPFAPLSIPCFGQSCWCSYPEPTILFCTG